METGTFFVNVECAIYKEEKWLMIVRSDKEEHAAGTLSMPGGTVEYTDSMDNVLEDTIRREVLEEVGVTLSDKLTYLESKHFLTASGERVLDIVFISEYASGEPSALSADEVASVEWLTIEEIQNHQQVPPWILQSMNLAEAARQERKDG